MQEPHYPNPVLLLLVCSVYLYAASTFLGESVVTRTWVEGGVKVKDVNVGGMTFREGDKLISQAVSVNPTDVQAFYKLLDLGIDLSLQQVAANKKEPLDKKRLDEIKF